MLSGACSKAEKCSSDSRSWGLRCHIAYVDTKCPCCKTVSSLGWLGLALTQLAFRRTEKLRLQLGCDSSCVNNWTVSSALKCLGPGVRCSRCCWWVMRCEAVPAAHPAVSHLPSSPCGVSLSWKVVFVRGPAGVGSLLHPFCTFFSFWTFRFWVFMPCSCPQFPVVPVIPTGPRSTARGWALLKREVKE